jgi:hypothetical protein
VSNTLVESGRAVAGAVAGGAFGAAAGIYARSQATAAVKVRPNLADVGFVDALLTSHGMDWLFYQFPTVMFGVMIAFFAAIGFLAGMKA